MAKPIYYRSQVRALENEIASIPMSMQKKKGHQSKLKTIQDLYTQGMNVDESLFEPRNNPALRAYMNGVAAGTDIPSLDILLGRCVVELQRNLNCIFQYETNGDSKII